MLIDFMNEQHNSTKRDYVARVVNYNKAECAKIAKLFGQDYWDGERQYGYGGYSYDGRWRNVANKIAKHYNLQAGQKVLDVGCGKAYLLYELTKVVPGLELCGIDISNYGIENAKLEMKPYLQQGSAVKLPFADNSFDLVLSLGTLHNLYLFDLVRAIREVERVSKKNSYIMVESYRNEEEKANLLYWQLTCEAFFNVEEWAWLYQQNCYTGDYGFIFFQ